jgi:hypothetical protein
LLCLYPMIFLNQILPLLEKNPMIQCGAPHWESRSLGANNFENYGIW